MSEANGRLGGNMTCDRPLRELTGVPEDGDEAEELESEPWEEGLRVPLATEEEHTDHESMRSPGLAQPYCTKLETLTLVEPPVLCHHLLVGGVSSRFLWRYGHGCEPRHCTGKLSRESPAAGKQTQTPLLKEKHTSCHTQHL